MISYPTYTDVCARIYVWIFMLQRSASHIYSKTVHLTQPLLALNGKSKIRDSASQKP